MPRRASGWYQTTSPTRFAGLLTALHTRERRLGRRPRPLPDSAGETLPPRRRHRVAALLDRLTAVPGREDRLQHLEVLPAREAVHEDWPGGCPTTSAAAFAAQGVARPWRHQVVAADAAHAGDHVIVATGTASGKSLAYQLPALVGDPRGPRAARRAGRVGALPRPDQGAGPRPARRPRRRSASTYASPPTTATARARSGTGRATSASTSSPTPTCSTGRCCPRTTGGRGCSGRCATSWSTSATTTAACSGPTSPTCCGGCGGCARCTAPTRRSCSPRPPSPSRRSPPRG